MAQFFSPENENANYGLAMGLLSGAGWSPTPQGNAPGMARGMGGYLQGRELDRQRQAQMAEQQQWQALAKEMGLSGVPASAMPGLVSKMLTQEPSALQEKLSALQAAGVRPGSPEYLQAMGAYVAPGGADRKFAAQFIGVDSMGRPVSFDPGSNKYVYGDKIDGLRTPSQASAFDVAREREIGKGVGGAQFSLPEQEFYANETLRLIDEAVKHPGKNDAIGFAAGRMPALTPAGQDFKVRLEQVQGRAFLAARQMLKGGGQITDFESKKAEQAVIRAERAQTVEAFDAAMADFADAVRAGQQKLKSQAGMNAAGQPGPVTEPPAAPAAKSGIKFLGYENQ